MNPMHWPIGLAFGLAIFEMVLFEVLAAPRGALPLVFGLGYLEPVYWSTTLAPSTVLLVMAR